MAKATMYNAMGGALGTRNAFTVHNKGNRRYYSSIDATILINMHPVEEIVQIQWSEEEQTMPLFGYNSYTFDEMAKGSRVIAGQFAINFTVPDYLNLLIHGTTEDNISFKNTAQYLENDQRAPHYGTSFDICVGYGSKDSILGEMPCIFLKNCYVKSCGQALDTQGSGIVEIYQFIAQDKTMSR